MQRVENKGCRPIDLEETISHLGGRRITSAFAYTGTRKVQHSELRLRLFVNGKPGHTWYISITVSAADLYDIELWSVRGNDKRLLDERCCVYFDELQLAVEALYDKAIKEHNGGVIYLH